MEWVNKEDFLNEKMGASRMRKFLSKPLSEQHYSVNDIFNPLFNQIDRIIEHWEHIEEESDIEETKEHEESKDSEESKEEMEQDSDAVKNESHDEMNKDCDKEVNDKIKIEEMLTESMVG